MPDFPPEDAGLPPEAEFLPDTELRTDEELSSDDEPRTDEEPSPNVGELRFDDELPPEADPEHPRPAFPRDVALIEAVLFMEAEAVDENVLARISGLPADTVAGALELLAERCRQEDSGLELSRVGGGIMFVPKREHWETLKDRYGRKNEARISRAAMETLAIIAYSQPITRSEIRAIRGVSPDNMLHLLQERDFIKGTGKKDVPGKPVQYGTTKEFLKHFRLNSIADLPKLGEDDLERFRIEGEG